MERRSLVFTILAICFRGGNEVLNLNKVIVGSTYKRNSGLGDHNMLRLFPFALIARVIRGGFSF